MMPVTCVGCARPISDRFVMTVLEQTWHSRCVQCADCSAHLSDRCYAKDGKLYCKPDFFKRFATQCGSCKGDLSPSDLVRRAVDRVYHLHCFTCTTCKRQLDTGEEYFVLDSTRFMCKKDYMDSGMEEGEEMDTTPEKTDNHSIHDNDSRDSFVAPKSSKKKQADRRRSSVKSDDSESEQDGADAGGSGGKKRTPRTNITNEQLDMLSKCFADNDKPTREVREELSQKTGLTMRVIQVWFQNKRSKEKRLQTHTGSSSGPSTPGTAAPTTPLPPPGGLPPPSPIPPPGEDTTGSTGSGPFSGSGPSMPGIHNVECCV